MPISEPDLASRASMVTGLSCPAAASTSALSRRSSLTVEPAGMAQAEFARPSPGRGPNRDFSFPCYISPETPGQIITTPDAVTVRLERRAFSPVLRKADLPPATPVPWWGGRPIRYEIT